jgi:hypothetical protein
MGNDSRSFVGPAPGGQVRVTVPPGAYNFNELGAHALGRSEVMAETLIHVAYLKAGGKLGSQEPPVSSRGAKYQDIRGSRDYVRAHRATLSVNLWNRNIADFAEVHSRFQDLLIAPQAATDPLPPPANYGDRLLEIESEAPTIETVRWVLRNQPANRPVEVNMLIDGIEELIFVHHQRAYERAVDKAAAIRRKRGWTTGHLSLEQAAALLANPPARSVSHFAEDVHELMEELRTTGPQSGLIDEWIGNLKFSLARGGPSQFGELADIYLTNSMEHARHFSPKFLNPHSIEEACERLDEAAAQQSTSDKAGDRAGPEGSQG